MMTIEDASLPADAIPSGTARLPRPPYAAIGSEQALTDRHVGAAPVGRRQTGALRV